MNSLFSGGRTGTQKFTAYISPYLVVSQGGAYTKHIYIGSQRIVSKLGDLQSYGADPRRIEYAGANIDGTVKPDYPAKYTTSIQNIKDRYAAFNVPYNGKDNDDYVNGQGFCCTDVSQGGAKKAPQANDNPEKLQFYYSSDHLGSSSIITDLDGNISQHIEYVPYGEVFIEERNNTWNTPYLFNGKELDEETGLYYYGARYYNPRVSLWLSVDPLWEKYPNISSYAYCANNPINIVDIDGRLLIFAVTKGNKTSFYKYDKGNFWVMKPNGKGGYYQSNQRYNPGKESVSKTMYRVLAAYRKIENSNDEEMKATLKHLSESKNTHYITENKEGKNQVSPDPLNASTTTFDLDIKAENSNDFKKIGLSDLIIVSHEMRHQYDQDIDNNSDDTGTNDQNNPVEIRAVHFENRARDIEKMKHRTTYGGKIDPKKLKSPSNYKTPEQQKK